MNIEQMLSQSEDEQFTSKSAKAIEEAEELIEASLDYVTTFESVMLFRKRK